MRTLSLFAGIGGADLALEALGCETVAFSEVDVYASAVFAKRFPNARALGDVREVTATPGEYDIVTGGFPCQDISNAGKRAGLAGERSGLWSEFHRIIGEAQPKLVLIENVSALLNRGLLQVLTDLNALGYEVEWDCIPAAAVGALHLRDRIWIVAHRQKLNRWIFGPDRERCLVGRLDNPPTKMPRRGALEHGHLWSLEPIARRKTKRHDGRTYWNGVNLYDAATPGLWPTPTARDWKDTGDLLKVPVNGLLPRAVHRHELGLWPTPLAGDGKSTRNSTATRHRIPPTGCHPGHTLTDAVSLDEHGLWPCSAKDAMAKWPLLPTPSAISYGSNQGGAAGRVGTVRHSLESMARLGLWPTPTRSVGTGGPGRSTARTGGDNLRTAAVIGPTSKRLNPWWVEWLMGFPLDWTNLDVENADLIMLPWTTDPGNRTTDGVPKRKERLTCCGNAQVPLCMFFVAGRALEAIR